ncbi:hypothetical protein OS128_05235 [Corynebacterium sp. P5848]|uniref:hypothetical protein n=1 Tax=Corynebacterium marambiense TaxID=2765364 RepID=UPI002260E7D5|nr:hypothetical protein [Corynebacterium marambiense]MCX7542314.1 hypothetical protein [Corynebacterium marambiense]
MPVDPLDRRFRVVGRDRYGKERHHPIRIGIIAATCVARTARDDHRLDCRGLTGHPVVVRTTEFPLARLEVYDRSAVPTGVAVPDANLDRQLRVGVVCLTLLLPLELVSGPHVDELRILEDLPLPAVVLRFKGNQQTSEYECIGDLLDAGWPGDLHRRSVGHDVVRDVVRGRRRAANEKPEALVNEAIVGTLVLKNVEELRVHRRIIAHF